MRREGSGMEVDVPGLGVLRGTQKGEVAEFLNVPYGKIAYRFALPTLASGSTSLDCTKQGPLCPQTEPFNDNCNGVPLAECAPLDVYYDELKCLNMRVHVPIQVLNSKTTVPVVIWLHGGSNVAGTPYRGSSNACEWVERSTQQGKPFIMLTPHYRVGLFGWFPHNGAYNQALADQRLALRWVHVYGKYIGADASRISLMGQSSGASNAYFHACDELTPKLCRQVALLSGNYHSATFEDYEKIGRAVAKQLNCTTVDLESVDAHVIVKATRDLGIEVFAAIEPGIPENKDVPQVDMAAIVPFRLVVSDCPQDGDFILDYPAVQATYARIPESDRMSSGSEFFSNLVFGAPARKVSRDFTRQGTRVFRQICAATNAYDPTLGNNHMVELHYIIHGYANTKPEFDAEIREVQEVWSRLVYIEDVWPKSEALLIPPNGELPKTVPLADVEDLEGDAIAEKYARIIYTVRAWPDEEVAKK